MIIRALSALVKRELFVFGLCRTLNVVGSHCEVWRKQERNHEDPLFRIQFFNRDEVESDMMEEEVM